MDKVSVEIKDMKAKVATERLKQKSQEKIERLTKERDWFRDEALRLSKLSKE